MPKYRKKPVVIEAVQWTGNNVGELRDFLKHIPHSPIEDLRPFEIETLEGNHKAIVTDFIIIGIKGEAYPCKEDIFLATYEKE
mgnify:FL=1